MKIVLSSQVKSIRNLLFIHHNNHHHHHRLSRCYSFPHRRVFTQAIITCQTGLLPQCGKETRHIVSLLITGIQLLLISKFARLCSRCMRICRWQGFFYQHTSLKLWASFRNHLGGENSCLPMNLHYGGNYYIGDVCMNCKAYLWMGLLQMRMKIHAYHMHFWLFRRGSICIQHNYYGSIHQQCVSDIVGIHVVDWPNKPSHYPRPLKNFYYVYDVSLLIGHQ